MKKFMSVLVPLSLLFATRAPAQNFLTLNCENNDLSLQIQIENNIVTYAKVSGYLEYEDFNPNVVETSIDGTSQYSFLVSDSYDTNTWFDVYIQNNQIVKRETYESGNDSDNYYGRKVAEGDNAFICK
ncbi:hypothetical protein [Bdellovibrio bacteriovorus]|uniref:hypothetical protein n=1 Tax=Bdellovibrio TaxID=958 RepID=UPI0035A91495